MVLRVVAMLESSSSMRGSVASVMLMVWFGLLVLLRCPSQLSPTLPKLGSMATDLTALIEAGRELAPEDRYEIACQMIASADEETSDSQVDTGVAWKAELHRRIDDIESGRVQLVSGPETLSLSKQWIAPCQTRITARAGILA